MNWSTAWSSRGGWNRAGDSDSFSHGRGLRIVMPEASSGASDDEKEDACDRREAKLKLADLLRFRGEDEDCEESL